MQYLKKSLGQNFLIDGNIINKIISLTDLKNKNVVEIGPGDGALTYEILKKKPKKLFLIEKDSYLAKSLKKKLSKEKNITIFNDDILKFDLENICKNNSIILGNLPYNISSQIIVKILNFKKWPPKGSEFIFMFQKELGQKITGKFSSKDYGRLSILANFRLKVFKKFIVSPNCFFPRPKVYSMVIHFKPKKNTNFKIKNINNLEKITNILFSNRRKMINKSMKKILNNDKINQIPNLNVRLRPEEIKPEIYYKITELFEKD